MLVGFHTEGHDHLILRAFMAKLLGREEASITPDQIDLPSRGWGQVLLTVPQALRRFYGKSAKGAVVAIDNDGAEDLLMSGASEDASRPRHWNHAEMHAECRFCVLAQISESVRGQLTWNSEVPLPWPIVVTVPVEAIESWLLVLRALHFPGSGSLHAERERRAPQKLQLYSRPGASLRDVEAIALPLVRTANSEHLVWLRTHSKSFELFAKQVEAHPW